MKNIKYIFRFLALCCCMGLLSACQEDFLADDPASGEGDGITFFITAPVDEQPWLTRAADGDTIRESLSDIRYLLADSKGNVLKNHYSRFSAGLDRLYIDGLVPGDYTIVFLGSSQASALAEISEPDRIDDTWLANTMSDLPLEGSYFYKKIDFTVEAAPKPMSQMVVLERPLAKFRIDIPELRAVIENMISSVRVKFDEPALYASMNADGTFAGEASVTDYELRDSAFNLSFATLPSFRPVSGTVTVRAATMSGDSLTTSYRFENLNLEAGKATTVSLGLKHPDLRNGYILIRPRDYYDYNADLMMMEDEPLSVLHDSNHRRYQVCKPLTLSTWENQLRVRLFMAAPVDDVEILADFPTLGLDSVRIGHMDRVEPFLDMLIPMPFLERDCQYFDVRGKRVEIPKMASLPATATWYYNTPDAYLKQLSELKFQRWYAWCPSYETYWARYAITPTCDLIRHGFQINQCMAIMFDSDEFYEILEENRGTYVDKGVYLTNEDIINRVYNVAGFGWGSCNPASGAVGWGGGSTMIFMANYFRSGMYPGTQTHKPVLWERETLFHEFGHCLGFDHDGNMTYGGKWVGVCGNAYINCFLHGKIPYGVPDFVNSVPYRRADAPKWAKPRFVLPPAPEAEEGENSGSSSYPKTIEKPIA